jgi:hypothetical protein
MSIVEITNADLKPSFVTKPDMRFATTFLSNKYRDYAVRGEAITDKATGEIFIKRPADGRVVSFFQNKKYLRDLAMDMKILLNSNPNFYFPDVNDKNACYVSTDFDMMSIYDEKENNIMDTKKIVIPNDSKSIHQLKFPVSKNCNGFFLRLTSRDSDKILFSWLTGQYNAICSNYTGSDNAYKTESAKLSKETNWWDSDSEVSYKLDIYKNANDANPYKSYDLVANVRVNEESCVIFPENVDMGALKGSAKAIVTIKNVYFRKLDFMLARKDSIAGIKEGIEKFEYPDKALYVRYINICYFADKSSDITLLNNEFLIALLDMPYINRYMIKMSKLVTGNSIIYSVYRPTEATWMPSTLWAEPIRHVTEGGVEKILDAGTDFYALENYLSKNGSKDSGVEYLQITTDANRKTDILAGNK